MGARALSPPSRLFFLVMVPARTVYVSVGKLFLRCVANLDNLHREMQGLACQRMKRRELDAASHDLSNPHRKVSLGPLHHELCALLHVEFRRKLGSHHRNRLHLLADAVALLRRNDSIDLISGALPFERLLETGDNVSRAMQVKHGLPRLRAIDLFAGIVLQDIFEANDLLGRDSSHWKELAGALLRRYQRRFFRFVSQESQLFSERRSPPRTFRGRLAGMRSLSCLLLAAGAASLIGCYQSHELEEPISPDPCICCGSEVTLEEGEVCEDACPAVCPVETCDCCGTTVEINEFESCEIGICDPYCLFPPPPPPITCDCCGFEVSPPEGECNDTVCMPYCGRCVPTQPEGLIQGVCLDVIPEFTEVDFELFGGGPDGCYCGESLSCELEVVSEGVLQMRALECFEDIDCDACLPFQRGRCTLPGLPAGDWQVIGQESREPLFSFNVSEGGLVPERGNLCQSLPDLPIGCGADIRQRRVEPVEVCFPPRARSDAAAFEVEVVHCNEDNCPSYPGPCSVSTFDDTIRITTSLRQSFCDGACDDPEPGVCTPVSTSCWVNTYDRTNPVWRLEVDGVDLGTIELDPVGVEPICMPVR